MDRKYILTAFVYAIIGLGLGIFMAASKNHGQLVTHAHIMMLGFLVSFVYALCYKLWLNNTASRLATLQFYIHQVGTFFLLAGLFLFYGNFVKEETIGPVLGLFSILVFTGVILMTVQLARPVKHV